MGGKEEEDEGLQSNVYLSSPPTQDMAELLHNATESLEEQGLI